MPVSLPMLLAIGGGGFVLWKMLSKPTAVTDKVQMPTPSSPVTTVPRDEVATPISDRPIIPVVRPIQTIYDLLDVKMVPFNDPSMVMQITKIDVPNGMVYGRVIAGSQAGEEFDMSADTVLERLRAGLYRQVT